MSLHCRPGSIKDYSYESEGPDYTRDARLTLIALAAPCDLSISCVQVSAADGASAVNFILISYNVSAQFKLSGYFQPFRDVPTAVHPR
jgi:hypothetical protein